jgi:hypothetical protein
MIDGFLRRPAAIFALALLFSVGAVRTGFAADQSTADMIGSWHVEVTTYDCQSGRENKPFVSLLAFSEGGTLTGSTANPAFLPGQRSGETGYWSHVGSADFTSVSEAFIEFASAARGPIPPFARGHQRIEQWITLANRNLFQSEAALSFFDENGTVVATGCAKAIGRRLR